MQSQGWGAERCEIVLLDMRPIDSTVRHLPGFNRVVADPDTGDEVARITGGTRVIDDADGTLRIVTRECGHTRPTGDMLRARVEKDDPVPLAAEVVVDDPPSNAVTDHATHTAAAPDGRLVLVYESVVAVRNSADGVTLVDHGGEEWVVPDDAHAVDCHLGPRADWRPWINLQNHRGSEDHV